MPEYLSFHPSQTLRQGPWHLLKDSSKSLLKESLLKVCFPDIQFYVWEKVWVHRDFPLSSHILNISFSKAKCIRPNASQEQGRHFTEAVVSKAAHTLEVSHTRSLPGEEVQLYCRPSNLEILESRATREGERAMCWKSQL